MSLLASFLYELKQYDSLPKKSFIVWVALSADPVEAEKAQHSLRCVAMILSTDIFEPNGLSII